VTTVLVALFVNYWQNGSSPITLYPAEVRDYNGTSLSSIADVYENAIAGTQHINITTYKLAIFGLVNKTVQLSYDDVITEHQLYQKVVTIYCVEGWDATILWEGVLVKDLIQDAGPDSNANTIIFHAADGYSTALPRDYVVNNNIILAYKMNNLTIPPERGFPFQLVAESKYGYKWIKWVTGIELSNNISYLGYWESRGYSNDATIP
jgi:DMSO/TMAO reductase YedYZ molybdopterin-dependent catalytic subunit